MRVRLGTSTVSVLILALPALASAHGSRAEPAVQLHAWLTLAVLTLTAALYVCGVRRRRGRWPAWRSIAAAAGAGAVAGALLSPLDRLAALSATAHMVQHTLLIAVAAPLLAAARPLAMVAAALAPVRLPRCVLRAPSAGMACVLHAAALWTWHLPGPYELALRSGLAHACAHATLLGTAILLWWSVARGRARATGVLWLFITVLHAGALGALLALSRRPWFASQPSLEDQQLAGLVMWIPAGTVLTALALFHLGGYLTVRSQPARVLAMLWLGVGLGMVVGCDTAGPTAAAMVGGDPARGPQKILTYGCATCHTIPGVPGAAGTVGPPLTQIARRSYVAGGPNDPARLLEFLRHPRHVRPGTPMPEMNVTDADARDIAAYLYTLR